jgi:hypothetical protein
MIDRYEKKGDELIAYIGDAEIVLGLGSFEEFRLGASDPDDYWDFTDPDAIGYDIWEFVIDINGEDYIEKIILARDSMIRNYEE